MAKRDVLVPLVQEFFQTDVVAATRGLETMADNDALAVLRALPATLAARACRHLPAHRAADFLAEAPPAVFREIVEKLEPALGAAILTRLTPELRERFLEGVSPPQRRLLQELLTYPADSAGRIMTTDVVAFRADVRVRDALARMRTLAHRNALTSYTYVTDADGRLVGVLNVRDVLLAGSEARLESIMRRDVFAVHCLMDREAVAHELAQRGYFVAPVVDPEGRLLGVVHSDQLIGTVQDEATEDLQKMFGAGADERVGSSVAFSLRKRLPWLHVNLATAFLAAAVVGLFEGVIARVTALAVLLPVVAGQGGNAGAQSLAVVMRGLVMREIPRGRVAGLIWKEASIGLANGLIVGAVTGLVSWAWTGSPYLGVVITLAMIANLVAASIAGAGIPLAMRALGLDPAQSSNIILTTVTDVVGFFAFLGIATLLESRLG